MRPNFLTHLFSYLLISLLIACAVSPTPYPTSAPETPHISSPTVTLSTPNTFTQTAVYRATSIVNTRIAANANATAKALTPTKTPVPPTPTLDPASFVGVWSVYENTLYGFTFEYPAIYDQPPYRDNCGMKEDGNGIHIGQRTNIIFFDSQGLSIEEYADGLVSSDWTIESRQSRIVSNQPAITLEYRFGGLNRYGTFTLLKHKDRIVAFDFTAGAFCNIPESEVYEFEVFHHVIETFQIIE